MSGNHEKHGRREAPGGWWGRYRAWVAGLSRGGRIRYRLCQVLAVLAVLILGTALYLRAWIRLPNVPDPPSPVVVGPADSSNAAQSRPSVDYEGAELPDVMLSGRKEGYYTFLLAGRDTTSGATDTMMLITYNTRDQKIDAVSLLRDTMINTSAKRGAQKRLNVVFARNLGDQSLPDKDRTANGMTALKQEVGKLTGIYPDFYVLVEWEAIGRLVDAINGVEFEVPFDMNYDDDTPGQNLHIHQKAGLRLLNGDDAMQVIRFRKNSNGTHQLGDAGRTQIQRDFLTAVLKKCLTPEILLKVPTLAQIFMDNVSTDLTLGNILAFAQLAVGMDAEKGVRFRSMPYDNVSYQGAALVTVRQDELLELLNDGLNPYLDVIGEDDLQLMYKKSGGGFGVTNAALLDPAVGQRPAPAQPQQPSGGTDPDPGAEGSEPAGGEDSPGITDIDPSEIFPGLE